MSNAHQRPSGAPTATLKAAMTPRPAPNPAYLPEVRVRLATIADAASIAEMYNREVRQSTATFDLVPRTLADQEMWLEDRSGAFSAIVAVIAGEIDTTGDFTGDMTGDMTGEVVGFAALSPYKDRPAYRTTVEDSVYVHREHAGRGIGQMLLAELIVIARNSGFHTIIGRIEASGEASRALHHKCGFELVGVERQVGRKFNRWLDVAVMQLVL
jgi:L-amino acid N-acyltransferase YncA